MSDYTTKATVELDVNGTKATEELNRQKRLVEELLIAKTKAEGRGDTKTAKKLEKEYAKANRELKLMQSNVKNVESVLRALDKASPKELKSALRTLNKELASMKRNSPKWDAQVQRIKSVKAELEKVNATLRTQESVWQRLNRFLQTWQTAIIAAVGTISGLVFSARKAVESFAAMEQEMANVRKYTGMTADEVNELNEDLKKIDTRKSREELNQLAQEAGRLGKTSHEGILGFVRASNQIDVALDDLGDGATLTLSKLTGIFGVEQQLGTEKALLSVGSVVNDLSQNCTASAPYITEFTSRLGGVGAQANLTIPHIMAYGAVLDSNNQKVEASATALSQVITRLYQDPAKYAKSAGLDVKQFSALVKTDMNQALITLLEQLHSLGNMDVLAPIFKDMGENGSRAISALSTLASKIEDVKSQQEVANQSFADATSITKEYDVQNNTVQAGLEKAKNRFHELSIKLGEQLLPVMKYAITTSSLMVKTLSVVVDFIADNKSAIITLTASLVAYTVAANAATIKTKAIAVAQGIAKVATVGWTAVTKLASAAMYLFQGQTMKATVTLRAFSSTLKLSPIGLVAGLLTGATTAFFLFFQRVEKTRKELTGFRKSITDLSKATAEASGKEIAQLKLLYEVATNDAESKEKRIEATNKLKELYPQYFSELSNEIIMTGKAKSNYDNLASSIINAARAKAAAAKIEENQLLLLDLESQRETQQSVVDEAQSSYDTKKNAPQIDFNPLLRGFEETSVSMAGEGTAIMKAQSTLNEEKAKLQDLNDKITLLNQANDELSKKYGSAIVPTLTDNLSTNPIIPGDGSENNTQNKFAKEDEAREEALLRNRIAYAKGEKDYKQYISEKESVDQQYYESCLARTDLTNTERLQKEAEYHELKQQQVVHSIEEENKRYEELVAAENQRYLNGQTTFEAHNSTLAIYDLDHKDRVVKIYKEGTKERLDAEREYNQAVFADAQKRHNAVLAEEKKHQDALMRIKTDVFGMSPEEKSNAYTSDLALLTEVYNQEVQAAGNNSERLLEIEEAFHLARLALKQKYDQQICTEDLSTREKLMLSAQKQLEFFESEQGRALTGSVDFISSSISSVVSGLTSIVQAESEKEIATINKKYDAEIAAAGDNSAKVAELEKKKEKEVAKVKNEASKKQFKMQVIQAVAQMAQNALAAYGSALATPIVGVILAPIAMAMAIATSMIQIVALKKQQQQAEAQGYAEGGFTRPGKKYEPAGVVHAGEWVASQELLASPVARPIIDALDHAQRTNTIGSLSRRDVSRSITAPTALVASSSQEDITATLVAQTLALSNFNTSMNRLNTRLDEPFVTVNTVTGDNGIKAAQDEYDKLIKNKSRR